MMNFEAEALALAALDSVEFGALTEADRSVLASVRPDDDVDELIEFYEFTSADFDGRRFIMNVDGDCYIIDGSTVVYLPVETSAGGDFELASVEI